MRTLPLLLTLLLPACDPIEVDTGDPSEVDADLDGYSADRDCDDGDRAVSPRASERCDGIDNDCDTRIDEDAVDGLLRFADVDGDGYGTPLYVRQLCEEEVGFVEDATDCDDQDPDNHPGADETCDGVDNDCDAATDEPEAIDAPRWYWDQDGDGHGNAYVSEPACEAPEDYVADGDDCDDADPDISPSAVELCDEDGVDEDCDLAVNDADDRVLNPEYYYRDEDQDGHGDLLQPTTACEAPDGYVALYDDCDDTDPWSHPDAAERCGDSLDQDCDGDVDEEGEPLAWYADADGDGYGDADTSLGEGCEAPDAASSHPGDCDDDDASVSPAAEEAWYDGTDQDCDGASDYDADQDGVLAEGWGEDCDDADDDTAPGLPEVCDSGADEDCDGTTDPCDLSFAATANVEGDQAGAALTALGDLDGDGGPELALGGPRSDEADDDAGYVWILRSGDTDEETLARASWQLSGSDAGDRAGAALASVDLDGDGLLDLAVGAPGSDLGLEGAGSLYLWWTVPEIPTDLAESDAIWTGQGTGDGAGAALGSAGDADGDGLGDLLVGAPQAEGGAGRAFLVLGPASGDRDLSWSSTVVSGVDGDEHLGTAVLGEVDVDGDGLDDLLLGGPTATEDGATTGAVWLMLDPPTGDLTVDEADARWTGSADGRLGSALADAGDLDGDGLHDLALAAPEAGIGGEIWLLTGGPAASGVLSLDLATASLGSSRPGAALGTAITALGDLDGDGLGELLLGAPGEDDAASDAGAAWLVSGPLLGELWVEELATARIDGRTEGGRAGTSLAALDRDGDGLLDAALGAPGSDADPATAEVLLLSMGGF